jgi:HK97 family phage major capsid protein
MTAVILEERASLLAEAQTLINEPLDDGKRSRLDDIQTRVASLDEDLERAAKVEAMAIAAAKPLDRADTMHRRSRSEFSITKAIRAAIGKPLPEDDDGFEREVQSELRRTRSYDGIAVPMEALETRAPIYTSTSTSSNIIPTDHLGGQYVDALRPALISSRLGVSVLTNLQGDVEIPAAASVTSASWVAESGAFSETTPTFSQLSMSPKKLGCWSEYGYAMVLQSSPGIEGLIRADLSQSMSQALDTALIYGGLAKTTAAGNGVEPYSNLTGNADVQPHGVVRRITNTARASDANGKVLTFAEIEALIETLDQRNVPNDSRAFLLSTREKFNLMGMPRFASDGDRAAQLAFQGGNVLGERAVVSNLIDTTEHAGTGSANKSSIFYANWSDAILAFWDSVDLMTNPYADTSFKRASVLIRAMLWADVMIRRSSSFVYYDGVLPA